MNLSFLNERVRGILKALQPEEKSEQVPIPPDDPDAIEPDPRVGDASPDAEDMQAAGEEAAAGGEEEAPEGGAPEPDGDEEAPPEEPLEKAFDEEEFDAHGNHDLDPEEMRAMQKAFGHGGLAEPEELLHGGQDLEGTLSAILNVLEDQNAIIKELREDIARLKRGTADTDRKLAKAFESLGELRIPVPAGTKAITKALPSVPQPVPAGPNAADAIYKGLSSGEMTFEQAQEMCRSLRSAR